MRFPARLFAVVALLWATVPVLWASPRAEHVFIFSIDGGKPAAIGQSAMPVLKRLAAEGAYTWDATTIFPSITLPSHTSMLTGVTPEKHHILWNSWKPRKGVVGVPTIFAEAKKAGFSTAMFVGKEKFRHLLQPGTVDEFEFGPNPVVQNGAPIVKTASAKTPSTFPARIVALTAARYIVERKPNLCFIHFPDPDTAGHKHGWGSPQQLKALADVDAALGEVLQAIDSAGIQQDSVLIITADHGGHRRTHGSKRPEDMHIPWIAWGKNVKRDYSITAPVNTCDTAATALWLLDVPCPDFLDGRPVTSAFADKSHLANTRERDRVTAH
jgi:predicted AlkP superfamily pyrophosphatase or phosphodiesterase